MKKNKFIILFITFCIISSSLFALDVPSLTNPIVDNAGLVSEGVEANYNQQLIELSDSTGAQLAILTIPSLEGEVLESYSMKVAETWKLGSAEKDNGVLLLIALEERSIRIEVGYGLEGILTDTKCGLIIRNVIAPEFRNGNYQAGIINAINNIVGLVKNDESLVSKKVLSDSKGADPGGFIFAGIALLYGFIFVMAVVSSRKRGPRAKSSGRPYVHHVPRSFSSRSGGGFSGGGGGFGGGGASGGW